MVLDESGHGMKVVLDESGIGTKVVVDEIFTFGMKVVLDELVFYLCARAHAAWMASVPLNLANLPTHVVLDLGCTRSSVPTVSPEPDAVSHEDLTAMHLSSSSAGPPPTAGQGGRPRRDGRPRSRERVPPHSSSLASQQPQLVVPPSGVQQTQSLATQGADEDSATVDPQNRVSDRSRSS